MPRCLASAEGPVATLEARILAPAKIPHWMGQMRLEMATKIKPWTEITSSGKRMATPRIDWVA